MTESSFQFLGFRVSELRFSASDSLGKQKEELNQHVHVERAFDPNQKRLVQINLTVTIKTKSENLDLFLKLKGLFKGADDMDEDTFQKLSESNAPAILYPFARAILASLTAQSNIPQIILPVANFMPIQKVEDEDEAGADGG
jgi:preprotein translocase subunit SecB